MVDTTKNRRKYYRVIDFSETDIKQRELIRRIANREGCQEIHFFIEEPQKEMFIFSSLEGARGINKQIKASWLNHQIEISKPKFFETIKRYITEGHIIRVCYGSSGNHSLEAISKIIVGEGCFESPAPKETLYKGGKRYSKDYHFKDKESKTRAYQRLKELKGITIGYLERKILEIETSTQSQ